MDYTSFNFGWVFGLLAASAIFSFIWLSMKKKLQDAQSQSVLADLELATTDQLKRELRSRPNNRFIYITPMQQKDHHGMQIEFNLVAPYDAVSMMHLATALIHKDMKEKGMDVPDLPLLSEDDE